LEEYPSTHYSPAETAHLIEVIEVDDPIVTGVAGITNARRDPIAVLLRSRGRSTVSVEMSIQWEPSVRTRHLIVIIALSFAAVAAIASFSLLRMVALRVADKARAQESISDALFFIAQREILAKPETKDPASLLKDNREVQMLLRTEAGSGKEFEYIALLSSAGTLLAESGDTANRDQTLNAEPIETLSRSFWPKQFAIVLLSDRVYKKIISIKKDSDPFADVIAGISTANMRRELRGPLLLSSIFALSVIGIVLLLAVLSTPIVLKPLRDVFKSIEQLEVESAVQGEESGQARPLDPNSITQRLQVLGRRFAGSRNELEVTRDQLRQVIGSLSESVVLLDREQRILLASPEAVRVLAGRSLEIGKPLRDAIGHEHPISRLTDQAFASKKSLQEVTPITSNGGEPQKIISVVQIFEDRGRALGALLALRDLHTMEQLENQLDFATKVAALNRITAGVAHEVKNPLHAMVLHLELLNAKLANGGDPHAHVDVLVNEVNRLNRVVQTFLDFNRPVQLHPQLVDVNVLVHEVLPLVKDLRASEIVVVERYGDQPLPASVDVDVIKQALLNIIINACQAMTEGGRLTVTTSKVGESTIQITISDQGPGISPELREKIFNLYFTTKPSGSGIGLAQAFRALQLHNGRIEVDSTPGKGSTFRIIFPIA